SEASTLRALRAAVNAVPATPQNFDVFTQNHNTYQGEILLANLLTGDGGVFNPAVVKPEIVSFLLTFPSPTQAQQPDGGWPVTIFGHGLTRSRIDSSFLQPIFANAGQAVIAIDAVWHGDRAICTGSAPFLNSGAGPCRVIPAPNDDAACANPA